MNPDLKEALEALHDLRQFWFDNVTQTRRGVPGNPMWHRVADLLDRHGKNENIAPEGGITYFSYDPKYRGYE
jgi:hypothetical protein